MHQYDFLYLVEEYLHWLWQLVKLLAPFIDPDQEPERPPDWWYEYFEWWEWYYPLRNNNWRPTENVCRNALWALRRLLGRWITEEAEYRRDQAVSAVRQFTGHVREGYSTFEAWVGAVSARVGSGISGWAWDLSQAAQRLYSWLPEDIRQNITTWVDKLRGVQEEVWSWVLARYEEARQFAYDARSWINNLGQTVRDWWEEAHALLDDFRRDPFGFITERLGSPWRKLVTFAEEAIDYYYNLWSQYAKRLAEFLDNPLLWLYDRVESFLVERW